MKNIKTINDFKEKYGHLSKKYSCVDKAGYISWSFLINMIMAIVLGYAALMIYLFFPNNPLLKRTVGYTALLFVFTTILNLFGYFKQVSQWRKDVPPVAYKKLEKLKKEENDRYNKNKGCRCNNNDWYWLFMMLFLFR